MKIKKDKVFEKGMKKKKRKIDILKHQIIIFQKKVLKQIKPINYKEKTM